MSDLSAIQQAQRIYDAMLPEDDDDEDPLYDEIVESINRLIEVRHLLRDKNYSRIYDLLVDTKSSMVWCGTEVTDRWMAEP